MLSTRLPTYPDVPTYEITWPSWSKFSVACCVGHASLSWGIPSTRLSSMLHWTSVTYLHFQGLIPQLAHHWVTTTSCILMKCLLPPPVRQFSGLYCSFVKFSNKGLCVFFPVALLKFQTSVSLFSFLLPFMLKMHPLQPNPNLPYYRCPTRLETILYNGIYKRLDNCLWLCWSDCLSSWLLFSCYFLVFPSCLHLPGVFFLLLSLISLLFRPFSCAVLTQHMPQSKPCLWLGLLDTMVVYIRWRCTAGREENLCIPCC